MIKMKRISFFILVTLVFIYTLFPFYWAAVTSLKSGHELFQFQFFPTNPAWQNYLDIFTEQPFGTNILNSVIVAGSTVLLSSGLGLLAAFSFARNKFRGRRMLLYSFLIVSMFPQIAILSGLFELIRFLGLYNNLAALGLSYMIFTLPFTTWNLFIFMREIPKELEEAAILDGAGSWSLITRIFGPIMIPSLVTTGILGFIAAWNEFLFALTFSLTDKARTVPVAIAFMSGASEYEIPWTSIMAASVTVTLPVIVLVLTFQKRIVSGLLAGALKG